MNRRKFLRLIPTSALALPLVKASAGGSAPASQLPAIGETRTFVEEIFIDEPNVGSHTQSRAFPMLASQRGFHSARDLKNRLVQKCWNGKSWELV